MAIVRPFKSIRPSKDVVKKIAALPYDVMNRDEAKRMAEGNPLSFLHVSRADIDFSNDIDPYGQEVYERAKENLGKLISDGNLIEDDKAMLYIYRQTMEGRSQVGIVACVSIDEYENNIIKKHELTRVEKERDRIEHFYICDANTEPIFLTYRENNGINALVDSYANRFNAEYDFEMYGVRHELWQISDDSVVKGICGLFKEVDSLYIADGHHRSASAYKVGLRKRQESGNWNGEEEFNFVMAAIFPDSQLNVMDYNRVIRDLNGNSKEELLDKIKSAGFTVEKSDSAYSPKEKHSFGMYMDNQWYILKAKKEIIPHDIIGRLDVSILQDNIISKILGIDDPRTDNRIDFVGGIKGMKELEKRVKKDMSVAFSLYPVDTNDIMEISDNDLIMPPKSTWFEPKLASGLFIHKLK